jgi:hypothetical protein
MTDVVERIHQYRQAQGWTITELAVRADVDANRLALDGGRVGRAHAERVCCARACSPGAVALKKLGSATTGRSRQASWVSTPASTEGKASARRKWALVFEPGGGSRSSCRGAPLRHHGDSRLARDIRKRMKSGPLVTRLRGSVCRTGRTVRWRAESREAWSARRRFTPPRS